MRIALPVLTRWYATPRPMLVQSGPGESSLPPPMPPGKPPSSSPLLSPGPPALQATRAASAKYFSIAPAVCEVRAIRAREILTDLRAGHVESFVLAGDCA